MNEVIIRESKYEDRESVHRLLLLIAELHRNGRPDMFGDLVSKYDVNQVGQRLSAEDNGVFVAETDGKVVGYVFCDIISEGNGLTLYIDDLCVDPESRSHGIGTKLLDRAKEYAEEKNCRCVMLNVWEFNENAVEFYKKYGFKTRTRHMEIIL